MVPLCPSLVALIVALPATMPVTRPVALTMAMPELSLAHVTVRPERMLPFASLRVAVTCSVPLIWTVAGEGLSVTDATGAIAAVTVSALVPLLPSLVAVIVAEPAATPLTRPLPLTVATPTLLLAQVTVRPLSAPPLASLGVAVSCTVCPVCTLAVAGLTLTDATGTIVTDTVAEPLWPSLVAVIVADPAATPATRPVPLTVAAPVLPLAHVFA